MGEVRQAWSREQPVRGFVARLPEAIGALKVDSYHVFATGGEAAKSHARVPVEIVIVLETFDLMAILQPRAPGIPAGDD